MGEEEPAQAASKPSLDPPGESSTKDFEGGEEVNKEVSFQWKFHSENSTLSIIATLAKEAWFSVAFPEVECQMAPAEFKRCSERRTLVPFPPSPPPGPRTDPRL